MSPLNLTNPNQQGSTTMSQLNPILATLGSIQTRTAMMAQLAQAAQGDTIRINRKDLQQALTDISQTISSVSAQLSTKTDITFSSSVSGSIDHPMVEQFWDVYDCLDSLYHLHTGTAVNHHSTDADTIAINIHQVYNLAHKQHQPLPDDMVELKQRLQDSCRYPFVEANVAVNSDVFNGKTIKCWIFQKSVAADKPSTAYTDPYDQPPSDASETMAEMAMTERQIIRREPRGADTASYLYIPSVPVSKTESTTPSAFINRYGVVLPTYYHDIDVSQFCEKTYTDNNGDQQRVLVPLFKTRGNGEHTEAFYKRVGLLLPPID